MQGGLTPTAVLRYLNRMLGSTVQILELTEEEMMRVVFQESLMTFSKYFPYQYRMTITAQNQMSSAYPNVYVLPNEDKLNIISIHDVMLDNMNQFGGSLLPLVNDPFISQEINDYMSMTMTRPTFEFRAPNLLTIRPKLLNNVGCMVELNCCHPKHLKTIPLGMRDEFLKLCLYDVLLSLYPIRHRFESYNTPFGQLNVFFEQVDSAKSERDDLLAKWQDNLLRNSAAKKIWIA